MVQYILLVTAGLVLGGKMVQYIDRLIFDPAMACWEQFQNVAGPVLVAHWPRVQSIWNISDMVLCLLIQIRPVRRIQE